MLEVVSKNYVACFMCKYIRIMGERIYVQESGRFVRKLMIYIRQIRKRAEERVLTMINKLQLSEVTRSTLGTILDWRMQSRYRYQCVILAAVISAEI